MSQVETVSPSASTRRMGIGGKLLAAFGAIAALTIAATVIAWALFANVRENLAIIAQDSLPEMAASFGIAEQSAQISATIPDLIATRSPSELTAMMDRLGSRLDTIVSLTEVHSTHESDAAPLITELERIVEELQSHIERLGHAVNLSLSARQQRESLLDALSSEYLLFSETVDPIIEAAREDMIETTRRRVADGTARIAGLVDQSFEGLRGVMQIQANINLITTVLHQVAASNDVRVIRDRRFAIVGPIADIKNQFSQVSDFEDGHLYVDLANEILDFALGSRNVFELRTAILAANEQRAEALGERLKMAVGELNEAHAEFLVVSRRVIESVDAHTLEAAADASREGQTIVLGTEEGIRKLETVLAIHSNTSEMFSLLTEAGTAIYREDIDAIRLRFDLLSERIRKNLIAYDSIERTPAVRAAVEAVLTFGGGDLSIPSSRLSQLDAEENAASILDQSQRLAGQLSQTAQGLVDDAEKAGASAELRTLQALAKGEFVLIGIAALSLAAAVLIVWLYVFRRIVRRMTSLSSSMLSIADGDLDTEIVFGSGNDEISDMRKALVVFRDDAFRRRQAEEAVRESEKRLRLILATSPVGVGISRVADGTIVYANDQLASQLGSSATALVGSRATDFYADAADRTQLLTRVESDGSVRDAEVRFKRSDGSEFWSLLSFFPIEFDGETANLGWVYDITDRKNAEQELRVAKEQAEAALADLKSAQQRLVQTEKMASLGQLTAGVAHEIKNPLNFVKNFAEISTDLLEELKEKLQPAIEKLKTSEQQDTSDQFTSIDDMLAKIKEHGLRADRIVQSMLSHTREGPAETRPTDLNALLEECLDLAYHSARAEDKAFNVTLERDLDPDIGELELYPADLMRVFLNLIGNAFYATKKRASEQGESGYTPTVEISTMGTEDAVEVRVRDNGSGIPAHLKKKIFDPFFTTKPPGEGTGLGLSLSYETVVQQHEGWMEVSSEEGQFTEFLVTLPR